MDASGHCLREGPWSGQVGMGNTMVRRGGRAPGRESAMKSNKKQWAMRGERMGRTEAGEEEWGGGKASWQISSMSCLPRMHFLRGILF